jgi:preprotein translocase subunit SecF
MRPLKLVKDNTNVPFLSFRWWALAVSIFLIIGSIAIVAVRGLNWGADFSGGQSMRVSFVKKVDAEELRSRVDRLGIPDVSIQESSDGKEATLRIPLAGANTNPIGQCFGSNPLASKEKDAGAANATASKVRAEILKSYPGSTIGSVESVSGKVSCELFSSGSVALSLAMLGIALFIWFRFEWQFGVGALVTLFHDVVLTFGFFALTQLQFDLGIVAAILTITGYSLNDTIVVYDRIRENLRKYRKMDMTALLDLSMNETLSRTVTTSLSLILTLGILLAMGPEIMFGFTAAMLLGIVIGTFSSIYISAPVLLWLRAGPESFIPDEATLGKGARAANQTEGFLDR